MRTLSILSASLAILPSNEILISKNISKTELSKLLNVSQPAVSRYFNSDLKLSTIARICYMLDIVPELHIIDT